MPKGYKVIRSKTDPSFIQAKLYNTIIVSAQGRTLTLNTNGWYTNHTKKCMNLFLQSYKANVYQLKNQWYITYLNDDCTEVTELFKDNMQIRTGVF